jgi:hypothetical protein
MEHSASCEESLPAFAFWKYKVRSSATVTYSKVAFFSRNLLFWHRHVVAGSIPYEFIEFLQFT